VKRALNGGRRLGVRPVKLLDPLARMQRPMPCDTTSQGARRRRSARRHPARALHSLSICSSNCTPMILLSARFRPF
jgi:hypothetical protein